MKFRLLWVFTMALGLLAQGVEGNPSVKFLLVDQVLVADPAAALEPELGAQILKQLQDRFKAHFPGQCRDFEGGQMDPGDRVVLVLPVLNGVRVVETVKAGSIHVFEAVVVGSLNVIDPWTDATLYSATRMLKTVVELGESRLEQKEARLREAFRDAGIQWATVCVQEIKDRCQPFVLSGPLLDPPPGLKTGGVWPFGARRGVRGIPISRSRRTSFQLQTILPGYSIIQTTLPTKELLPAGEIVELTVVERPAERGERLVSLKGVDLSLKRVPQALTAQDASAFLPRDILLSIAREYLTKGQALRILPVTLPEEAAKQWALIREQANARFSRVRESGQSVSVSRDSKTDESLANPDLMVEFRILNVYHGIRRQDNGVVQHLYRCQLGATALKFEKDQQNPSFNQEGTPPAIVVALDHTEEIPLEELPGIREIDQKALWFSLCRNAMIGLAEKLRNQLEKVPHNRPIYHEGRVEASGQIQWMGRKPSPSQPLDWLRPSGELMDPDGRSLGVFFQLPRPVQGVRPTLNSLGAEKLKPGDQLRFKDMALQKPPVWLMPPELDKESGIGLEEVHLFLAMELLRQIPNAQFVRVDDPEQASGPAKGLKVMLSAWTEKVSLGKTSLSAQARIRLMKVPEGPEPLFKAGVLVEHQIAEEQQGVTSFGLKPFDQRSRKLKFLKESIDRLIQLALQKGLPETMQRLTPEE